MKDAEIQAEVEKMEAKAFQTIRRMAQMSKNDPKHISERWVIDAILTQDQAIKRFIAANLEDE